MKGTKNDVQKKQKDRESGKSVPDFQGFHIDRITGKVDLLKMRNITLYKDLFPINRLDIQIIAKLRMSSVFFEKE